MLSIYCTLQHSLTMRCTLLLLLGVVFITGNHQVEALHRNESQVYEQLLKYVTKQQTDSDKEEFNKIIEVLSFPHYVWRNSDKTFSLERQSLVCVTCRATMKVIINLRKEGKSEEEIIDIASDICTSLEIQPGHVCRGAVATNADIIIYIIDNIPEFTPENFCGVLLQSNNPDSCPFKDDRFVWSVDIPPKPTMKTNKSEKAGDTFKIIHFSDIHYDPAYEAYGLAACNEPTCCRVGQTQKASRQRSLYNDEAIKGRIHIDSENNFYLNLDYADDVREARMRGLDENRMSNKAASKAGYWGDYRNCDTPWWAVEDGIDFMAENDKSFDYVYYTGDTIDHGVWETSRELITESVVMTTKKMKEAFGDRPVYQAVGNHESQPTNQFSSDAVSNTELSTAWLYDLLWEQWKQWLPAEAEVTLKKGGYYTALPRPGLRVVVLNSNICYVQNWWIHYDPRDTKEQLVWLVDVLSQAEASNEKVHILSHIPAGSTDCLVSYNKAHKRIIERFADIITAEFNGHTHNDEFKLYYNKETGKPIVPAFNGGSLTTYSNINHNYRVYDVDSSSYEILDAETWIYNLTEANLTPQQRPRWFLEYTFKEKYNVKSLKPEDLDELIERFVTVDQDLFTIDFFNFRGKSSDPFVNSHCDDGCVRRNIEYLTVTEIYDRKKFDDLYQKYLDNKNKS